MNIRFVTKTVHAYLDYPVATSLIAMPFILRLGRGNPAALWLSVATGLAALLLTLITDHKTGIWPLVPYRVHLWVDRLVGVAFLIAPALLHVSGLTAAYYWVNGAAVLLVTVLLNATAATPTTIVPAQA